MPDPKPQTDRAIRAAKPAPGGQRREMPDTVVSGL